MKRNLKNFVDAGYKKKSEAKKIDNYVLDEELSTKRDKVYYDPSTGKAVHTIAGTDTLKDWSNNALIPLGLHEYSNRYKNAESIQKKANKKYGKDNVDLVTHSQSGNIAENLANKNLVGGENTTLNPAIIGKHNKNVKVVKSMLDPVSLLTNTNKNDVKIMPKTFNPIAEHSTDILEKTKNVFGFGIKAKRGNKSMKCTDYDSDSSSDEELGLDEQKIMKKMNSLHKDIAKLHQKHGVKKSVIKGFKMLGEGIVRTAVVRPEFKPAVEPPSYRRPTKSSGSGATGKMLKEAAANATVGLINSGANRAIHEMDTRGKKGAGFKKGSQEAKEWGRKMREVREAKKK